MQLVFNVNGDTDVEIAIECDTVKDGIEKLKKQISKNQQITSANIHLVNIIE